ncbi:HAMP domain-containing sensor histidine kinase [Actinoplanes sp. NPDC051851]|uniref:sensor histidine kinase n=1 Tax=Actinoplanes sp. NPDC051851 TaxID=3154753 RepID=UPI00343D8895
MKGVRWPRVRLPRRPRSLRDRLALLVTGAVTAAVLVVSAGAWFAVWEIQKHQVNLELNADAKAIAANPEQWLETESYRDRDDDGPRDKGDQRELGPCWQILDSSGNVLGGGKTTLPVTSATLAIADGTRTEELREEVSLGPSTYRVLTTAIDGGGAVQIGVDQAPYDRVLAVFAGLLALGCAVGIALAALLGRTVARAGLAPVERLALAVEEVALTQDLSRPIDVHGDDEIARLGSSVNAMLTALDVARGAQRALVEDASHELRTPLTSIRTNVELLLELERRPELAHRLPPEERTQLLHDLDAQVRELATLTNELVELAREEATREPIEPVDLAEVVTNAVNRVRTRAPALTYDTSLAAACVPGRYGELERMVVNVLDNAAKWSPPGGTITIRLSPSPFPGGSVLTVTDSGPGVAPEDLPHVFDRFYRAPAARSMPGSGLGLAIVAQTATHHGGSVDLTPTTPHGTTVTIRLPAPTQPS